MKPPTLCTPKDPGPSALAPATVLGDLLKVATDPAEGNNWLYALEWGERVLILGGEGRLGQVTPPA
jgi:hypothetical protein